MSLKDKYLEYKQEKKERDEELRKRNPERLPTKMNLIIRIIAGGYLVYIAYSMRGALTTYTNWKKWLFLGFMILFTVVGAWACINGIIQYAKKRYFDPNKDDFSEEAMEAKARAEAEERDRRQKFLAQAAAEIEKEDAEAESAAEKAQENVPEEKPETAPDAQAPAPVAEPVSKSAEETPSKEA